MKAAVLVLSLCLASASFAADSGLRIAPFRADVTPPIGPAASVEIITEVKSIEHPLELRGVVLEFGGHKHVLAAIDYCGISNASYDIFREKIASAVGAQPDDVALQSLHQHTAPVLDADAARIMYTSDPAAIKRHEAFPAEMGERAGTAAKQALAKLQPVTRIVASRAKVNQVASNRRVRQPDGSIATRWSKTTDAALREAPEGLIDPWLRTLTFFAGDRPIVQVHYYATHPQTFYRDGRITWDVPGIARQRLEQESHVFQVYFTGCGGNITMGKYNDGTPAARDQLADRLYTAMKQSAAVVTTPPDAAKATAAAKTAFVEQTVEVPALSPDALSWKTAPLKFTPRSDGPFDEAEEQKSLGSGGTIESHSKAAMHLAWNRRLGAGHTISVSRLKLGPIQIVNLPGEPFVEFQLHAQEAAPKSFVCVAGYGDTGVWYYGPDSIYADRGGYEQTFSFTKPCAASVNGLLDELLRP